MAIESRYVSTSKASRILGVSTTLIKTLVDERKLHAWKTQGGHRRISLDSIDAYLSGFMSPGQPNGAAATAPRAVSRAPSQASIQAASIVRPQITVAVQSTELMSSIRACLDRVVHSSSSSLPRLVDSPAQALREMASDRPNVLVFEMTGSQSEQENALAALATIAPDGPPVSVLVVTRNTQLNLPASSKRCCVHVFSGPVSLEWSRGCLAGMLTLLTSLQWGLPGLSGESDRATRPPLRTALA